MRTPLVVSRAAILAATVVLGLGCTGDPNDPMTWAKQLMNLRVQKEALDHLANMDVEKARPAVPALIELYEDTKRPEHLEALARLGPCAEHRRSFAPVRQRLQTCLFEQATAVV